MLADVMVFFTRVKNLIGRLYLGRLNLGEIKSSYYKRKGSKERIFWQKSLLQQYALKMKFSENVGWGFVGDQSFSDGRKINSEGYQESSKQYPKTVSFFSGSTGWGWGIEKEVDTFHCKISRKAKCNVNNYAMVAYDLIKIKSQVEELIYKKGCPDFSVIYFGVNESFTLSAAPDLYETPKSKKINEGISAFNFYYYGLDMPTLKALKGVLRNYIRLAFSIISILSSFLASPKEKVVKESSFSDFLTKQYDKNKSYYVSMIDEIDRLLGGRVLFVLEPCLFFKEPLASYERKIINRYQSSSTIPYVMEDFYEYVRRKCNAKLLDVSEVLKGESEELYWDYCHPSEKVIELVSTIVARKLNDVEV